MTASTSKPFEFVVFYDGDCPICQKEIAWLRSRNQQNRLGFQDIQAADFDAARYGKTFDELMAEIHGLYPDGRLVKGVEVFYAAYRAVGLGWLMAPTQWPLLQPLFAFLYRVFARYRLPLGAWLGRKQCNNQQCGPKH